MNDYNLMFNTAKSHLPFMGYLLLTVWMINILNWTIKSRLNLLGLYPRNIWGLVGIVFAPILHANFNHLFFNTIPFFVLGMFLLAFGKTLFIAVSIIICVTEGCLVWLFGRKYIHIGASGLISGYFGFILGLAYLQPTLVSLILAAVTLYYFGSIFLGIFPQSRYISWESHLAGLVSGVALVFVFWRYPDHAQMLMRLFQ